MLYMIFRGKCGGFWQRGRSTLSSRENSSSGNCKKVEITAKTK
jgi:hypothetical protein